MSRAPVISPMRFSDHEEALIELYTALGLQPQFRNGNFVTFGGLAGDIAFHPLSSSSHEAPAMSLGITVPDVPSAVEALEAAGHRATWWDEAFGQLGQAQSPMGLVSVEGPDPEHYGLDDVSAGDGPTASVGLIVHAADLQDASHFLGVLGFVPSDPRGGTFSAPGAGIIEVRTNAPGGAGAALRIEVTQPLEALADSLRDLDGARSVRIESPQVLCIEDPDGFIITVVRA